MLRITQLYCDVVSAGFWNVATVPTGQRWLVRDVRGESFGASAYNAVYVVNGAGTLAIVSLFTEDYVSWAVIDSFVVLDEGDALAVYCEDQPASFIISGHVFDL